jgi:branched-chain amino acid transport system ATP-binding protein
MLEIKRLNAGYGDVQILWDIDLKVQPKSITALIGSNGAGKTTLLRSIFGTLKPYSGDIVFEGTPITELPYTVRSTVQITMIPEGRQLFGGLSVENNLLMGAYSRKDRNGIKRDLAWVYAIFPRLRDRRKQTSGTLSGGEAQMCAIGRGLMADPKFLMIDELSLGLAPLAVEELLGVLTEIQSEKGLTILMVDQDVQTALEISSTGYVLVNGRIEMTGDSKTLLKDPEIQKAYLGL